MENRKLGRTDLDVSAVGLGTEYLVDQPDAKVDTVIGGALDRGINYLDLFYAQPRFRDQMGAALSGARDRVILAAHLGAADVDGQYECTRDPQQCEHFFLDFLERYRTEYTDLLLLHNSDTQEDLDRIMGPEGLLDMATRLRQQGKARYLGFSGHNTATARQIVESGAIDMLMFPVNLTSHAMPGRQELLTACSERNVGLVAMKPYAGGNLLREDASVYVDTYKMGRAGLAGAPLRVDKGEALTPLQCISYVLAQLGVSTVVPGAADLQQLDEALAWVQASASQRDVVALAAAFDTFGTGECVHCNHCLPCPAQIDIGQTLRLLQLGQVEVTAELRAEYAALPAPASGCIECGDCVARCPFGVDATAQLAAAATLFE